MTANAIRISKSIVYQNGTLSYQYQANGQNLPQATKGVLAQTISATTAEADLSVSTLGTPGKVILHNLEATTTGKTFNWGLKSSTGGIPQYFALKPLDMVEVYYGTSAMVIRGKAASGTLQVLAIVFEA